MREIWCLCVCLFVLQVRGDSGESEEDEQMTAEEVLDTRKEINILDSFISYLDTGATEGDKTVLFFHGNPTAAYLWRNVIPHVSPIARCLAADMIGMGRSGKLEGSNYTYAEQYSYMSEWIDAMDLPEKLTIVVHDWGSGVGLRWADEHSDRVQAVVFMESMLGVPATWDDVDESERSFLQSLRTEAGEEIVLVQNAFIEVSLLANIIRTLTDEEMTEYRRPYVEVGESRRPILTLGRSFPVASEGPEDVVNAVNSYATWLGGSEDLPKLFIDADPGFLSPASRLITADWPNLEKAQVTAKHFMQEDAPEEIGEAIADFLTGVYMAEMEKEVLDTRKEINILDSYMSYLDTGATEGGETVVFFHGNPTAAYLWRNVIPHVSPIARCLAADMIGMGRSGKVAGLNYTFADHYSYLSAWMDAVDLPDKLTIVTHDAGCGLGLHWGNEHRDRVKAVIFMEAMFGVPDTWEDVDESERSFLQAVRTEAGEDLILVENMMIEVQMPTFTIHNLTDEVMAEYRRPYLEEGESRRPMLGLTQSFPVASEGPEYVVNAVNGYTSWLAGAQDLPKLFFDADPGLFSPTGRQNVADWPNKETVRVTAKHFLQEDAPEEIGEAIAVFLKSEVYTSAGTITNPSFTLFCLLLALKFLY